MKIAFCGFVIFITRLFFDRPDIIHIHAASRASFYRKIPFVILSRLFRVPLVYHQHGAEFMVFFRDECNPLRKWLIRCVLRQADVIIALSMSWKENLHTICHDLPVEILPNAVPLPKFTVRENITVPTILFMGRIGERKGVPELIDAVEIISREYTKFHLLLGGDGDVDKWREESRRRGLNEIVSFLGWVAGKEKEKMFQSADICVLPSHNEGLPMFVLEANSYGKPVVATDVGGVADAIVDNLNGYLIQPNDVEMLAVRLKQLIVDNDLRLTMGAAARKIAEEEFDIKKIVEKLSLIYSKMLCE
ncbi:glycosyltransferase [Desulfosediminicola sp.]|uniref:glycosyltransferase n=1 Tax=Desulfosediminicola sp. TaxID=2886825 RepID=UPI003AF2EBE1